MSDLTRLLAFPKPVPRKVEKAAKRKEHAATTEALRKAVFNRARGRCEACGWQQLFGVRAMECDHWLSGNGRRRQKQGVDTMWLLCPGCHDRRHANDPSAAHWNALRRAFCEKYGYPFTPHLEKPALRHHVARREP